MLEKSIGIAIGIAIEIENNDHTNRFDPDPEPDSDFDPENTLHQGFSCTPKNFFMGLPQSGHSRMMFKEREAYIKSRNSA